MSNQCQTVLIHVHLDRHGDARQERDDKLLQELLEEIKQLLKQEKYEHISPEVF